MEDVKSKQNIATTRTFDCNHTSLGLISECVSSFAVTCAEQPRRQESRCNALMLFIHTNSNGLDLPEYKQSNVAKLPYFTNSSVKLSKFANRALDKIV